MCTHYTVLQVVLFLVVEFCVSDVELFDIVILSPVVQICVSGGEISSDCFLSVFHGG
jgi:hypothetical protein